MDLSAAKEENSTRTPNDGRTYAQASAKPPDLETHATTCLPSPNTRDAPQVDPAIASMLNSAIETLATAIEIFKQHVRTP